MTGRENKKAHIEGGKEQVHRCRARFRDSYDEIYGSIQSLDSKSTPMK